MKKDMYGRTRLRWGFEWGVWWLAVVFAAFLFFQLSRPLWDADKLIAEKKASCEEAGMVMVEEKVRFGTNYYCEATLEAGEE